MHYAQGYCRECFEAVPAPAAGRKQLTREESAVKQAVERRLPPRERPTVFQALGLA